MAKNFPPGRCVHCLKYCEKPYSDHVFSRSWYPDTTPVHLEKWQIPSCEKCNQDYSKIENEILQIFGMCINPNHTASQGVVQKAIRAISPECGKNPHDTDCRSRARVKLIQKVLPEKNIHYESLLPSKYSLPNSKEPCALPISVESLTKMGEKFIRGITFVVDNRYFEPSYKIDIVFQYESNVKNIIQLYKPYFKRFSCGPGIIIDRAVSPNDPQSGIYYIEIWKFWYMYGFCCNKMETD